MEDKKDELKNTADKTNKRKEETGSTEQLDHAVNEKEVKQKNSDNVEKAAEKYHPEEYWKEKLESKKQNEGTEYHNCIFVDGKELQNFIINQGEIQGDIAQENHLHSGSNMNTKESDKLCFQTKQDLTRFLSHPAMKTYIPILLTIVTLKIVPVSYLYSIASKLKEFANLFSEESKTEGQMEKQNNALLSLEDIMEVIQAKKVTAMLKSEAGEMEVACITLKNHTLLFEASAALWENYPGLRVPLIDWLFDISKIKEYRQMLLLPVADALADVSALDFSYAKTNIISRLAKNSSRDDFFFLKTIMKRCLNTLSCKDNADKLLCHWCDLDNNDFLWKIALALVSDELSYHFSLPLIRRLKNIIKEELDKGIALSWEFPLYLFEQDTKVPFSILQGNPDAALMYLEVLTEQFALCHTRQGELRFSYYFTMLMGQDYMAEGYPDYRLLLINSLNQNKISKKMCEIWRVAWKKRGVREFQVKHIFSAYLNECEEKQLSWEYMKKFLRIIAFTGEERDYQNIIKLLQYVKRNYPGNTVAEEMKHYLENLLNSR